VSATHGLIDHNWNQSAFNRETFAIFMDSFAEQLAAQHIANACVILDNCSIHKVEDVAETGKMFGTEFNFLPPDSPMVNPVEGSIADIKRAIQTAFATVLRPALLNIATSRYGQPTRQRERALSQAFINALTVVTPQLVPSHQHHMMGQFPDIRAQRDV
jgi:transposase